MAAEDRVEVTDALIERVLLEMLDEHRALVDPEFVARASDQPWKTSPRPIDPHRLQPVLRDLILRGRVRRFAESTRGGTQVPICQLADLRGWAREAADAAARKRLLYARFRGWAQGTAADKGGLTGTAAERVVHQSLRDAAPAVGYQLANPDGGTTSEVLGQPIARGPLDNAAIMRTGAPEARYAIVLEVKSYRRWLYPRSVDQLYQLLYKAARLQRALPNENIVPVLVCRRAHYISFSMARDLGAFIIETRRQWVLPRSRVTEAEVSEVSAELEFDVYRLPSEGRGRAPECADRRLSRQFTTTLPKQVEAIAPRWRDVGARFVDEYGELLDRSWLGPLGAIREYMEKRGLRTRPW